MPAEFIQQYQKVSSEHAATCARAIESRQRVVIHGIEIDALSELERRIAAAGGYRAAQSTPLRAGNLLGVLSTYCRNPSKLTERDFKILDLYGRFTADLIERLQVEKTLRDSEERLRLATQFGKVGVWDWDLVANRMSWTDSLYVIHGVRPASFNATVENVLSMIHPGDRERVIRLIEKIYGARPLVISSSARFSHRARAFGYLPMRRHCLTMSERCECLVRLWISPSASVPKKRFMKVKSASGMWPIMRL